MQSTKRRKYSGVMIWNHAWIIASFNSILLLRLWRETSISSLNQIFSIGFKSKLFPGQSRTSMCWSCNHDLALAARYGPPSCWKDASTTVTLEQILAPESDTATSFRVGVFYHSQLSNTISYLHYTHGMLHSRSGSFCWWHGFASMTTNKSETITPMNGNSGLISPYYFCPVF